MSNEFLTKNEVAPYAEEYLRELENIKNYYIKSLEGHEEFIADLFKKSKSCTNPTRKVVLLADPNLDMSTIAKAKLHHIDNSYDTSIIIYFCPKFFNTLKGLKKMFEVAEQFIWHEATHLARMDKLGTDESHEPDIDDIDYLRSDAELNAFAIQSLVAKEGEDLAGELYDQYDELLETFEKLKDTLSGKYFTEDELIRASLAESTSLKEDRRFARSAKEDVIGPYQDYYNKIDYKETLYKYFEKEDLPYDVHSVEYDEDTRTLKLYAEMSLKAYGDSYSRDFSYIGHRFESTSFKNEFSFDKPLSHDDAEILFPLGLTKTDKYYPTKCFSYFDGSEKPRKLHWIDHIELYIHKYYD